MMPAKSEREIGFIDALKQWRKRKDGKTYYLGVGKHKNDEASYWAAVAKWKAIEAKLATDRAAAGWAAAYLHYTDPNHPAYVPDRITPVTTEAEDEAWEKRRGKTLRRNNFVVGGPYSAPKPAIKPLAKLVAGFLAAQELRYKHGLACPTSPQSDRISAPRLKSYRDTMRPFSAFVGNKALPETEAEVYQLLQAYRAHCQTWMIETKKSAHSFNERMKTVSSLFHWLYESYHITALPRKFNSLVAKFATKSKAKALEVEMVRKLYNRATPHMKCYIALAVNCGFYAIDISSLRVEDFKDDCSYIEVDRHKTGVPTKFKMWTITRQLVKQQIQKEGLAFVWHEDGKELLRYQGERLDRDSKIDNQLTMLKKFLGLKKISFSQFRDTSTTQVENLDPSQSDIFDGHKDDRQAVFYLDSSKRNWERLDKVIDQLETWYALGKEEEKAAA